MTVFHAKLIRTHTVATGADSCDYWYVPDESNTAKKIYGQHSLTGERAIPEYVLRLIAYKEQREYHAKQIIGKEFRNGFDADLSR